VEEGRSHARKSSEGSLADSDTPSGDAARIVDAGEDVGDPARIEDSGGVVNSTRTEDLGEDIADPARIENSGKGLEDLSSIEDLGENLGDPSTIEDSGRNHGDPSRIEKLGKGAGDFGKSIEDSKEDANPTVGVVSGMDEKSNAAGSGEKDVITSYTEGVSKGELSAAEDIDGRESAVDSDAAMDGDVREDRSKGTDVSREVNRLAYSVSEGEASFSVSTTGEAHSSAGLGGVAVAAASQSDVPANASSVTTGLGGVTGEIMPTEVALSAAAVADVSEPGASSREVASTPEDAERSNYQPESNISATPTATSADEAETTLTVDSSLRTAELTSDLQPISSDSCDPRSVENTEVSQPADSTDYQQLSSHTEEPILLERTSFPPKSLEQAPEKQCPMESGATEARDHAKDPPSAALLAGEVHVEKTFEMEVHQLTEDTGAEKTGSIEDEAKVELDGVETEGDMEVDVAVEMDATREVSPSDCVDALQEAVPSPAVDLQGQGNGKEAESQGVSKDTEGQEVGKDTEVQEVGKDTEGQEVGKDTRS